MGETTRMHLGAAISAANGGGGGAVGGQYYGGYGGGGGGTWGKAATGRGDLPLQKEATAGGPANR